MELTKKQEEKIICPLCGHVAEDRDDKKFILEIGMCGVCDAHFYDQMNEQIELELIEQ